MKDGERVNALPEPPPRTAARSEGARIMMQNLSASAIRRPIPPVVLFVLLSFAGPARLLAAGHQPVPPTSTSPAGQRSASRRPARRRRRWRAQVTRIVENAVATVGDVAHIIVDGVGRSSRSTAIEFQFGKDLDRAVNDVRDAVTRVRVPSCPATSMNR